MLKRVLAASGVTGVLGAMAFAVPAQADLKADCIITGDVKMTDKVDPRLGMRLVGGKGAFTYTDVISICVGSAKGTPFVCQLCAFNTQGWFQNTVCGTGKMVGTVDASGEPKFAGAIDGEKFAIEFVGFAGVFYWHDWDKADVPTKPFVEDPGSAATGTKQTNAKNYTAAGVTHLSPPTRKPFQLPNDPPGNCTKAFHIEGAISVDFA